MEKEKELGHEIKIPKKVKEGQENEGEIIPMKKRDEHEALKKMEGKLMRK